ncbi:S-adenosyl-L-methionine-dependent methyltransferase [Cladorrhinum samala]|uniref:S-adenosyl-L-methionine-dependent methyltransferase n=1 Tax=Cladorrhinum samala TaxID=585594 RepID=A0AAV9HX20_9PEZI|nr:S-adenosyl-L-methionine-dependent methyltransferase [Cladorrhinum samala]
MTQLYSLPASNKTDESARLEFQHRIAVVDADGALHLCPLPSPLDRVADIGAGTGVWAREFAALHPEAKITCLDLTAPADFKARAPPNTEFVIANIQEPWPFPAEHRLDFIHGAQILINVPDPKAVLARAYESLRPGGAIEFREFIGFPGPKSVQQGGEIPLICEWGKRFNDGANMLNGCDHRYAAKLPNDIEEAGFVDVHVVESSFPLGGWVMDGVEEGSKDHERMAKMDAMQIELFRNTAFDLSKAMFEKAYGWSEDETKDLVRRMFEEVDREDFKERKAWWGFRIVWARKPEDK